MTKGLVTNGGIRPLKMAVMATTVYQREIGAGACESFSVRAMHEGTCASYKTIS